MITLKELCAIIEALKNDGYTENHATPIIVIKPNTEDTETENIIRRILLENVASIIGNTPRELLSSAMIKIAKAGEIEYSAYTDIYSLYGIIITALVNT